MNRLTMSEQHRQCCAQLLALWLAAQRLGIKQGSKEAQEFEELSDKDGHERT